MAKRLVIRLLGQATLEIDGRPLSGLPSRAAKALLIYLVCHNRPLSRETLADLLWGERSQKQGLTNLRTILTGLRRELDDYLIITRQTLAFNHAAPYWLDVAEFESELAQLQPQLQITPPLPTETTRRLQAALELYQGDFLTAFALREGAEFEGWALWRQEQLKRLAGLGRQALVAHYLATGDYHHGLEYAEKLLESDPYDEAAQRQLMALLVRCGQPHLALQRYQRFSRLLAEELGIEPAPETSRLYYRIQAARALSSDNLPASDGSFVGRAVELQQIRRYLANPACRLVTLVGPGGIGKTRLALEAARQQQQSLLHGVCFVPVADLPSADFLMLAVAGALELSLHGVDDSPAQLLMALHEREMLLVLDDFEHLLAAPPVALENGLTVAVVDKEEAAVTWSTAAKAHLPPRRQATINGDGHKSRRNGQLGGLALLSDILSAAPEIKILVTSRERLNLEEEWLFQVEGLSPPDDSQAEHDLATNSAVQLFVQNARRAQSGFAPKAAELAAIGQICRLVEGLPLAIKLAAAWVRVMTCRQIAAEIESNLTLLQSSARNALPRQRSIQAVFEQSWRLLAQQEQQILAQLAVFRGGFKLEAAHSVAGADIPALARLVDKSWLSLNSLGRYNWHELLRRYASEKLGAESAGQRLVAARHAHYYATFLKEQQPSLENKHQVEALTTVTAELDNVRAAWEWAIAHHRFDLVQAALDCLWMFYEVKSWIHEGEEMFRRAAAGWLEVGSDQPARESDQAAAPDQRLLAQLLIRRGWFCMRLARFEPGRQLLEQGLSLARQSGDDLETGRALHHLGVLTHLIGQLAEAKQYLEESLVVYRQHGGTHFDLGSAMGTLGLVLLKMGRFDEAQPLIKKSHWHYRQSGNPRAMALINSFMGGFAIQTGHYLEAKPLLLEGLTFQKMIDDRIMIRMSLAWLGEIHEMMGEYDEARQQYEESLLVSRGNGDRMGMATALNHLARLNIVLGELPQAREHLKAGLTLAVEIHYIPLIIEGLITVSMWLAQAGDQPQVLSILIPTLNHPAVEPQMRTRAEQLLAGLTGAPLAELAAQVEPAETIEAIVARLLAPGSVLDGGTPGGSS
jgi:predicted ATPase